MQYRFILAALASAASAHTWVEQLNIIAPNGTMVGAPGFVRGNVKRGTPGFGDPAMVNLLPPNPRPPNQIFDSDLMCKDTQTTQTQSDGSPRLQAAAGANVALRYQENGHVTLPQGQPGKPENRGTVYVYGTTQPQADDKFLSIHRQWTADGQGGDKRGVLLSTRDFDDAQCYQVNGGEISTTRQKTFAHTSNSLMGADLWCQQDIQLPATAPTGQPYTLYWVWDWPTMPGTEGFPEGKQEIYTTCMDVDIVKGTDTQQKAVGASFVQGQNLGNAAVAAVFADIANPTAVTGESIPFSAASGTPSATDNSASTTQPNSQTSGFSSYATETASVVTATGSAPVSAATGTTPLNTATDVPTATNTNGGSGQQTRPSVSPIGATGAPTATNTNGGSGQQTRPSVSPIGATGAPIAQSTAGGNSNDGDRDNGRHGHGHGGNNRGNSAQNTATAIANNNAAAAGTTTTATVTGPASTVTQVQTNFQTIYQTKMETVTASNNNNKKKRQEATDAPAATEYPSIRGVTTSTTTAYSKTEAAYKLRARNPFYVVPGV
ncbi:hypothetical protein LTR24_008289 [Lithohypha guttulata]|uniref:DUF7492 domain-containing protein n=1 Tax=Lithohypha guttulata TaxID=1690604 RepID=A0ABR0K171_9EURO|nr:hypothetical protein LTR24_008289 [Lithohypha guttulata]